MSDSIFKLQLLARSELALTEIHARRAAARSVYVGIALVLALLGLGMFNLAGYLALTAYTSPAVSALVMAVINAIAASIMVSLSHKAGPSANEERIAREMREMAYKEVSEDVEEVKGRLENMAAEVGSIRENVARATSGVRFMLGMLTKAAK